MSDAPVQVEEIRLPGVDPRIRLFRAGEEVDTFVVLTRRLAVFVDTMATPGLMRQVVERVRPDLPGRAVVVLNTHADWDHVYGNSVFLTGGDLPGVIVASERTRDRLCGVGASEVLARQQRQEERFREVTLVPPHLTFPEHLTLEGGDLTLEVLPTPGHTDDHVSVWIPELRTLLAGDAAEFPFPHVSSGATLPGLRASLERLAALRPEVVLPCHGGTTDPHLLAWNLRYFGALEARPDLTYEAALAELGVGPGDVPAFYRPFHEDAVRATRELLASPPGRG